MFYVGHFVLSLSLHLFICLFVLIIDLNIIEFAMSDSTNQKSSGYKLKLTQHSVYYNFELNHFTNLTKRSLL